MRQARESCLAELVCAAHACAVSWSVRYICHHQSLSLAFEHLNVFVVMGRGFSGLCGVLQGPSRLGWAGVFGCRSGCRTVTVIHIVGLVGVGVGTGISRSRS